MQQTGTHCNKNTGGNRENHTEPLSDARCFKKDNVGKSESTIAKRFPNAYYRAHNVQKGSQFAAERDSRILRSSLRNGNSRRDEN